MHLSFKNEEIAECRGEYWFAFLPDVDLNSAFFYSVDTPGKRLHAWAAHLEFRD